MSKKTITIMIHTFDEEDSLSLGLTNANTVAPALQMNFYLASTSTGKDSTPIIVQANAAKTIINASTFGITDYPQHRYLTVDNETDFTLQYVIDLI